MRGIVLGSDLGLAGSGRMGIYSPITAGTSLALTLSGNEITDAVRAAALAGDGLPPEGSMGVWEATTNLITNGGMETNPTGWSGRQGTETLTRDTSKAKFGSGCLKVDLNHTDASLEGAYHAFAGAASTVYTHSVWVCPDAGITVRVYAYDNVGGFTGGASVLGDGVTWTRLSVSATTGAGAATFRVYARCETAGDQSSKNFYVDGVQVEQQPLATPYVETNGGTASRSASRVQAPASALDETQGWIAMRSRVGWSTTAEPSTFPQVFGWTDNADNRIILYQNPATDAWAIDRRNAGSADSDSVVFAMTAGDMVTLVAAWTATQIALSVNGAAFTWVAANDIPSLAATTFDIGSTGAGQHLDSDVFWFACGMGTLTDGDAAAIHAWGNEDPPPGLFPAAADLSLIWKAIDQAARTY